MTHHIIPMATSDANAASYGITRKSRNVYRTSKSHSPTRLVEWSNVNRPNPRNGQPVRYGDMGPRDGGNGKYLDPHNRATDDATTFLLTLESTAICADTHMNTGQPGSGQVYAAGVVLRDGDTATLTYRDHSTREVVVHFPPHNNGHGYATERITA